MSITDELRRVLDQSKRGLDMESLERLRRYVNEHTNTDWEYATFPPQRQLVNCTDTAVYALIDAIENEVVNMRNLVWNEGYDEGFASADDWLAQHEDAMAEHGWVKLPKDADGEYIHIGERVQLIGNDPSTVSHMSLADDGWRVYVKYDGGIGTGSGEPKLIHHHAPTVEDVLREFGRGWHERMVGPETFDIADYVERYAAKLRLAGDAE